MTYPTPEQEEQILADVAFLESRCEDNPAAADVCEHVKMLLAGVRNINAIKDALRQSVEMGDKEIESLKSELDILKERNAAWDSLVSSTRPYTELTFVTLLAVEAGELSEGRAVEMLKVNRMDLRDIRHGLIASLVEFSGKCKSPLTSLLATMKAGQDSCNKANGTQSSNSSGTENEDESG